MELDGALKGAYSHDKHRKQTKQTPSSPSQTVTPSEDTVLKNIDKASPTVNTYQIPSSVTSKSCNLEEGSRSRLPSGHRDHDEQRNNHAANIEDVERMTVSSLNSMKLLPDGVIGLQEAYGGVRKQPTALPECLPKRPKRINRPKVQMTVLSAGLRETKPSSLRMIRDPEEVLRQKRKLMSRASSQSQHSSDTDIISTSPLHRHDKSVGQENQSTISKSQHVIEIGPHLKVRHARPPSTDELIDIEDEQFDTAEDIEDFKLKLEETLKQHSSLSFTTVDTTEMDTMYNENGPIVKRNIYEMYTGHERVNIHYGDIGTCLSPVKNKERVLKEKPYEMFADIVRTDQKMKETDDTNPTDAKPRDKKIKKKKSRNPFKWLYKIKSAKVAPLIILEENTGTPAPQWRSKADLEKIATMFCVETPTQASLRKVLDSNEYVHDGEDKCFKPAVWDCDIGSQQRNVDDDVKLIERGIRDLDCNNNRQVVEDNVLTGINKMGRWLSNVLHKRQLNL